ncbi:MAG: hypothetical protein ACTHZX_11105, partial [Microbacterium sp.]
MSSSHAAGSRRRAPLIAAVVALGALVASPGLIAGSAPAVAAEAPQLTLSATEIEAGGVIGVDYVTDRQSETNWVAI